MYQSLELNSDVGTENHVICSSVRLHVGLGKFLPLSRMKNMKDMTWRGSNSNKQDSKSAEVSIHKCFPRQKSHIVRESHQMFEVFSHTISFLELDMSDGTKSRLMTALTFHCILALVFVLHWRISSSFSWSFGFSLAPQCSFTSRMLSHSYGLVVQLDCGSLALKKESRFPYCSIGAFF